MNQETTRAQFDQTFARRIEYRSFSIGHLVNALKLDKQLTGEKFWLSPSDQFMAVVECLKTEAGLINEAFKAGDSKMVPLVQHYIHCLRDVVHQPKSQEHHLGVLLNKILDAEYLAYVRSLQCHDWFYSFSDDAGVYRGGHEREEKLFKTATENGAMYLKAWDHFANKRSEAIKNSGKPKESA